MQILLKASGHASEESVAVIGFLLLQKTNYVYDSLVADGKYTPDTILFHSMFRAAIQVFGIDCWKSGFFADASTLYNVWKSLYGERLALGQFRPTGNNKSSVEYGIFAVEDPSDPASVYYDEAIDNELAKKHPNEDPIDRFQYFFPDFEVSNVHRRLASTFSRFPQAISHPIDDESSNTMVNPATTTEGSPHSKDAREQTTDDTNNRSSTTPLLDVPRDEIPADKDTNPTDVNGSVVKSFSSSIVRGF